MEKRLNALEVALNNELREREFYLTHAERTQNSLTKAMFEQIAGEENEHYDRLLQIHENWAKQKKWPETVPLRVKDTIVRDVLKNMLRNAARLPAGDVSDLEAIRTAIEFEGKGAKYYAELRDEVPNTKEKAFFGLLADIEYEHFKSLKDTEEFLLDPAQWYRKHEGTGLDGA